MGTGPAGKIDRPFTRVTDPWVNRGTNHDLHEMIFMALTATLCGANSGADVARFVNAKWDWYARYMPLDQGCRITTRSDACSPGWIRESFSRRCTAGSTNAAAACGGQGVAIDGKTHRGSP